MTQAKRTVSIDPNRLGDDKKIRLQVVPGYKKKLYRLVPASGTGLVRKNNNRWFVLFECLNISLPFDCSE